MKKHLGIEKLAVLFILGICLSTCIGCVCADEEIHKQEMADPTNFGVLCIYCNVENATATLYYHSGTFYYQSENTVIDGKAVIGIKLFNDIDSLNITADGYYPQNFTASELPLPTKKDEVKYMTVKLKSLSGPQSPFPFVGLIGGFGVAFALLLRYKRRF